jgi:hypothetical protein
MPRKRGTQNHRQNRQNRRREAHTLSRGVLGFQPCQTVSLGFDGGAFVGDARVKASELFFQEGDHVGVLVLHSLLQLGLRRLQFLLFILQAAFSCLELTLRLEAVIVGVAHAGPHRTQAVGSDEWRNRYCWLRTRGTRDVGRRSREVCAKRNMFVPNLSHKAKHTTKEQPDSQLHKTLISELSHKRNMFLQAHRQGKHHNIRQRANTGRVSILNCHENNDQRLQKTKKCAITWGNHTT